MSYLFAFGALVGVSLYLYLRKKNIKVERISNVCPFCLDEKGLPTNKHNFTECPDFKEDCKELSFTPYFDDILHETEEQYFHYAGIMPYCKKNGKILLKNRKYIGGQRKCYKKGNVYRLETSKETAVSEFFEESLDLPNLLKQVLWCSGCAIYLIPHDGDPSPYSDLVWHDLDDPELLIDKDLIIQLKKIFT